MERRGWRLNNFIALGHLAWSDEVRNSEGYLDDKNEDGKSSHVTSDVHYWKATKDKQQVTSIR